MTASHLAAAAGFLQFASLASADILIISQTCDLYVEAINSSLSGSEHPIQSSSAPGIGPWSDSLSVTTQRSAATASMQSLVSTTALTAAASTSASASQVHTAGGAGGSASAHSRAVYFVTFSVTAPTSIRFQASLPSANPLPAYMPWTQQMSIYFRNLSTGQVLAHVIAGWGLSGTNTPTIEPPVDLNTTLPPGQYQIDARLEHNGMGLSQTHYSDGASFVISLTIPCYANCDGSAAAPLLTGNDFQCFINQFASGSSAANCDQSTAAPILNANDFQCFIDKFAAGCS